MSKTEEIGAVQKTARVNVGSLTFESVRPLLGPRWTIEGEDSERYEKILKEVGAAAQPIDFIDWLLVKDIVDLTWEIQRGRRKRDHLMRIRRTRIAEENNRIRRIDGLVAEAVVSLADVDLQLLSSISGELDRLDERDERLARRRDEFLRQIERRRSGWAKLVRSASEEIIEGEFHEVPSGAPDVKDSPYASNERGSRPDA